MIPESEEIISAPLFVDTRKFAVDLAASDNKIITFQNALQAGQKRIDEHFLQGEDIGNLLNQRSLLIDFLLQHAWLNCKLNSTNAVLVAVGGYGRAELHPFSDIDILILHELNNGASEAVQQFITLLWDIGLNVGHSFRNIKQCVKLAKEDITVMTNLLESRVLIGNRELYQNLWATIEYKKIWQSPDFIKAKLGEQVNRHQKFGDIEYDLEPNVKESPGGLRDIQMIYWVAKRHFNLKNINELYRHYFATEEELNSLQQGMRFLWKVRYALHLNAGREQDKLSFEWQKVIAKDFNYTDNNKKLAVEQFMQSYYRNVMVLRELNDVLTQHLANTVDKKIKRIKVKAINERFQLRGSQLETVYDKVFLEQPSALLEVFVLHASETVVKSISADTIRQIRKYGYLIDDSFRQSQYNRELFLTLIRSSHQLSTTLQRMSRYAILGRYIPEFGMIVGQSQFDLFHAFPVDVHTLKLIANIRQFGVPYLSQSFPICSNIYRNLSRPELLILAGLFHDIGKGRGGDHSEIGAMIITNFAQSHGYSNNDVELLGWLVANHLLMSSVAQREDINDPQVIQQFAKLMKTEERLNLLFVLTVADIRATNPSLWNSYRSSLLRQLYMYCREELRSQARFNQHQDADYIKNNLVFDVKALVLKSLSEKAKNNSLCKDLLAHIDDSYFLRQKIENIVWHLETIAKTAKISKTQNSFSALKAFKGKALAESHALILTPHEKNYTFVALVTAAEKMGLNIVEAQIYRVEAIGYKLSCFALLDANMQPLNHFKRISQQLIKKINDNLKQDIIQLAKPDIHISRQLKQFKVPTQVAITPMDCGALIDVSTADRPGLLATIARAFVALGLRLISAKITTLGERVEDAFYVLDRNTNGDIDNSRYSDIIELITQRVDQQVKQ